MAKSFESAMTKFAWRPAAFLIAAIYIGIAWPGGAVAQKVRIAMPAKSMTFLNFYVGEKFGIYKAEGFEVSLEVIKPDVGVAGMVAGEIDYTSAIGTAMRAAATGVPTKAAMFTMDRVVVYMYAKPSIDRKSTRLNSSHIQKSRMPSSA